MGGGKGDKESDWGEEGVKEGDRKEGRKKEEGWGRNKIVRKKWEEKERNTNLKR